MNVRDQIMRDEGYRARAYQDSLGIWTIGYGTNLQTLTIDEEIAGRFLDASIKRALNVVESVTHGWTIDEPRIGALVNLCYNVGPVGFLRFRRLLDAMRSQKWEQAAVELLDSRYATQVGPRATRLAQQLRTGEWV